MCFNSFKILTITPRGGLLLNPLIIDRKSRGLVTVPKVTQQAAECISKLVRLGPELQHFHKYHHAGPAVTSHWKKGTISNCYSLGSPSMWLTTLYVPSPAGPPFFLKRNALTCNALISTCNTIFEDPISLNITKISQQFLHTLHFQNEPFISDTLILLHPIANSIPLHFLTCSELCKGLSLWLPQQGLA